MACRSLCFKCTEDALKVVLLSTKMESHYSTRKSCAGLPSRLPAHSTRKKIIDAANRLLLPSTPASGFLALV
eukprot:scaffold620_cov169-Amphora_coffeaeformis.AAC.10